MEILQTLIFILFSLFSLFLYQWRIKNRNSPLIPIWPVFGMIPSLLLNAYRIHDYVVDLMLKCRGTFMFEGPLFSDLNFLVTSDPVNVNHILGKNFINYEKGTVFREIFEPLGNGILGTDGDSWKSQRKLVNAMVNNLGFETFVMKTVKNKVLHGLIPILENATENEVEVDLKDLIHRLVFDIVSTMNVGIDPKSLSIELPKVEYITAMSDIEEAIVYRHVVPLSVWKLQRWLQIGEERKMRRSMDIVDRHVNRCISSRREKLQTMQNADKRVNDDDNDNDDEEKVKGEDLLTKLLSEDEMSSTMLRDHVFNLITAGHDKRKFDHVLVFWCVAKYPSVESKIAEEIRAVYSHGGADNIAENILDKTKLDKMMYLHATILEVLRLYPPVPINHKTSIKPDTLPTGHVIKPSTRVLISYYAMGRMKEIWGDDCLEFKPERWISSSSSSSSSSVQCVKSLIHVPSHVFVAFNTGPRFCVGNKTAIIELKMIAIMVIQKYNVRVVKDHPPSVLNSVVLKLKNDFKVMITKKCY